MGEWISVEARLPNEDSLVVGVQFYGSMNPDAAVFLFMHSRFHVWNDGLEVACPGGHIQADMEVTHWMPLPAPPEPHQGRGGGNA